MAKKRDRHQTGNDRRRTGGMTGELSEGGVEPEQLGMNFADGTPYSDQGDMEAWEDDQTTAPDLFAEASLESQVRASGGHTQQLDEEMGGQKNPTSRDRQR